MTYFKLSILISAIFTAAAFIILQTAACAFIAAVFYTVFAGVALLGEKRDDEPLE